LISNQGIPIRKNSKQLVYFGNFKMLPTKSHSICNSTVKKLNMESKIDFRNYLLFVEFDKN